MFLNERDILERYVMTFYEACQSCREGNFLSHKSFDAKQSMHEYKGILYYEDGAVLTHHLDWLSNQDWAKEGWYVKYTNNLLDIEKLAVMHKMSRGMMLNERSYEECVMNQ